MNDKKSLNDLPLSDDLEFWGEGQRFRETARPVNICHTHKGKEWMEHGGYIDNHDGTISCKWCPWGTRIPGYMKVIDGRVIDLRSVYRE